MTKIKKLFKTLLCACMLLGGLVFNPMNANAAKEETVTPYAAVREILLENKLVFVTVYKDGYTLNYYPIYLNGSYVYNTSSTGNYVTNVNIQITTPSDVSYKFIFTNDDDKVPGVYGVSNFAVTSYEAGSNYKLKINYKAYLRTLSGTNLGYCYRSATV